ncbi:hypothetical protein P5G51_012640 [Virgibacillus sp. 179-BFC.A HS]|uniref:Uncharacterized protein n=1 Tax=Tigheibacillus jepli TaxID=3035914 RepID=A0ABU5CIH4_9BACI|nr:hypothetical protein [Virgibacillus sp. 179-BFC.A HS]MDY0406125.1 hypothetical protein [Virgibacillus sp. 179-BFC.A HS]
MTTLHIPAFSPKQLVPSIEGKDKEQLHSKDAVVLTDRIEESTLPCKVDIMNLSKTDAGFREKVTREGIVWRDCRKE